MFLNNNKNFKNNMETNSIALQNHPKLARR